MIVTRETSSQDKTVMPYDAASMQVTVDTRHARADELHVDNLKVDNLQVDKLQVDELVELNYHSRCSRVVHTIAMKKSNIR